MSAPNWVWYIYYGLFIITILAQAYCIIRRRGVVLSLIGLVLTASLVPFTFICSLYRPETMNEFQFFFKSLFEGKIWAIIIVAAYVLIVLWWILFVCKKLRGPKCDDPHHHRPM